MISSLLHLVGLRPRVYYTLIILGEGTLLKLKNDVIEADIYNKLSKDINSNPNTNYDILAKAFTDLKKTYS